MSEEKSDTDSQSERRLEDLSAQVAANHAKLETLDDRADRANNRANTAEEAAAVNSRRIDDLETRVDIDRQIISELQADGVLNREHAAQLEEALRYSRRIGAAIGIVMANSKVSEDAAFALLKQASQNTNRKVRVLAEALVETGDISNLN